MKLLEILEMPKKTAKPGTFGHKLATIRKARGLTLRVLAGMCGLTGQAILYLETGQRVPTWKTVQLLCKGLNVRYEELADDVIELVPEADREIIRPVGRPRKPRVEGEAKPKRPRGRPRKDRPSE